MSSLIHNCRDDYNWMDDDAKDYSPGWKPLNQTGMTEQCIEAQDKYDIWKYRNSLELTIGLPAWRHWLPVLVYLAHLNESTGA